MANPLALLALAALVPAASDDGWAKYTSPEGGFEVLFPGEPTRSVSQLRTPAGPKPLHSARCTHGESGADLSVSYSDLPGPFGRDEADRTADFSRDNFIKKSGAELLSEAKLDRGELKGRHYRYRMPADPDGIRVQLIMRVYIVGRRIYDLSAYVVEGHEEAINLSRFFDSFALLPGGPVEPEPAGPFAPEGQGYSIRFPGPVDELSGEGTAGYFCPSDRMVFSVGIIRRPEGADLDPAEELDRFADFCLRSFKAEVVGSRELELDGHPGREVVADTTEINPPDGFRLFIRAYIPKAGGRIYDVRVAVPKDLLEGDPGEPPAAVGAFFNSFKLLPE